MGLQSRSQAVAFGPSMYSQVLKKCVCVCVCVGVGGGGWVWGGGKSPPVHPLPPPPTPTPLVGRDLHQCAVAKQHREEGKFYI